MTEGNGKLEQGIFQGRVLEALDTLKEANVDNRLEHRRLFKLIERLAGELATRKADSRAAAAKVSGLVVGVGVAIQGVVLWWTS